jgi:anti-sigma factor RsiW
MNCPESEELILESLDTSLAEERRAELQHHVAACPACHRFQQVQVRLDTALAKSIRRPDLSPGFSARVLQQVDQDIARTSSASIEARRQAAEAEYAAKMAELRKGPLGSRVLRVLDGIGLGVAGLLAGLLLSAWLPRLAQVHVPSVPASWLGPLAYAPWAAAVLVTAAGLALGSRSDLLARLRV